MKTTNTSTLLLSAIARLNPALPPRYTRVRAAMELCRKTIQQLAFVALDEKCGGPGTMSRKSVSRLAIERDGVDGNLIAVAFPNICRALDTGEWSKEALAETIPDVGEIRQCLAAMPGTRSAKELLDYFWTCPADQQRSPYQVPSRQGWDTNEQRDRDYHSLMVSLARATGATELAEAAEWVEDRWQECRGLNGDALRQAIEAWELPDNSLLVPVSGHTVGCWLECKLGQRAWWPADPKL